MTPELRNQIKALGNNLGPEMMQGSQSIFAALHEGFDPEVVVTEDVSYGPHERNRLDVFTKPGTEKAPVLVYLHGGGFVMGDKRSPVGLPFYQNVGDFAARSGLVGVTITYRLAPDHKWPAGPEDLASAIRWLRENIAQYGGDPEQIYISGQSAGAVHVASYVAHPQFHVAPGGGVAGAILLSCIYDTVAAHANQFHKAYYGEDSSNYAACSTTKGLIETSIPLLASVSEFDVDDFQRQAAAFVAAWAEAKDSYAPMLRLSGHNHLSPGLSLGSSETSVATEILNFIAAQRG